MDETIIRKTESAEEILARVPMTAEGLRQMNAKQRELPSLSGSPEQTRREWFLERARCPERHVLQENERITPEWIKTLRGLSGAQEKEGSLSALIGPRGTGKTQLAVDLIHWRIEREVARHEEGAERYQPMSTPCRYCEALDFFIDIKATYRSGSARSERQIIDYFANVPFLVIDEIGVRGETKWEDDLFFSMINKRYAGRKDTLLIGNLRPDDLAAVVGPSIASRMQETGAIVEATWPSFRSRS